VLASLEDLGVDAVLAKPIGAGESGEPGADDDDPCAGPLLLSALGAPLARGSGCEPTDARREHRPRRRPGASGKELAARRAGEWSLPA